MESKPVAVVKHGDRLEILQRRRKFLRVRSARGAEGWANESMLLASADMSALKDLASRAAKMPTQGVATVYSDLPVHTTTSVRAPSFVVIHTGDKVDVLVHRLVPRVDQPRAPLVIPPPKKAKTGPKKKEAKGKYPLPPMPKPPPPPADWLDLSKSEAPIEEPEPEPEVKDVPSDNWSLVRMPGGQTGWVLTRRLTMAIPDEVAQYAEGHRIVSYFALGGTEENGERKPTWLWTTIGGSGHPYDFDSFRVFVWSLRHHRYETAYVAHNVEGFEPVLVKQVEYGGKGVSNGKYPGFAVCVQRRDGEKQSEEFALLGNIVRPAGQQPCPPPPALTGPAGTTPLPDAPAPQGRTLTWWQKLKARLHRGGGS